VSELLVVGHDDVKRLLPMEECIELMASVLADLARGAVWQPLRFVVRPPEEPSLMGLMPAHRSDPTASYGLKAVCIFPSNAARGIDLHQGGVLLFDGETGALRALVDASAITATRTAAVSGVATRTLAREDARELAILGSGVQARSHLEAMAAARPFDRARVWSRTAEHAAAFAADAQVSFPVEAVGSAEDAVRDADVVVTATSSPEPIVRRDWLKTGAELGEVLTGSGQGRLADDELTVFKSLGLAAEDLAAAEHIYTRAQVADAGVTVPF
jgi:ornithine cyclodeaminase